MTLKWLSFFQKLRKLPSDWGLSPETPVHNTLQLLQFAQPAAQISAIVLTGSCLLLVQIPRQNPGCTCKVLFYPVDNGYVACPPHWKNFCGRLCLCCTMHCSASVNYLSHMFWVLIICSPPLSSPKNKAKRSHLSWKALNLAKLIGLFMNSILEHMCN